MRSEASKLRSPAGAGSITPGAAAAAPRLSFIDWMKAAGIVIIVVGHVASRASDWMTPPIFPKQLGVAFFIFVTGYTLAQERRPVPRVLFNRLFDIYLHGILFALLWSAYRWVTLHDLAESNYLPFVGGVNVLFNFFPANPSTWYIGTYLHLLLAWALVLRRVQVRPWMLGCALVAEIAIRAVLIQGVGGVLPYMLLSNWLLVLLLGLQAGQHRAGEHDSSSLVPTIVLVVVLAGWHLVMDHFVAGTQFPWMAATAAVPAAWASWLVASLVTVLYSGITLLMFVSTRRIAIPWVVTALSRHTLFIFIAHMPLFYLVQPILLRAGWPYPVRALVLLVLCLPGLAVASALVARLLPADAIRKNAIVLVETRLRSLRGTA